MFETIDVELSWEDKHLYIDIDAEPEEIRRCFDFLCTLAINTACVFNIPTRLRFRYTHATDPDAYMSKFLEVTDKTSNYFKNFTKNGRFIEFYLIFSDKLLLPNNSTNYMDTDDECNFLILADHTRVDGWPILDLSDYNNLQIVFQHKKAPAQHADLFFFIDAHAPKQLQRALALRLHRYNSLLTTQRGATQLSIDHLIAIVDSPQTTFAALAHEYSPDFNVETDYHFKPKEYVSIIPSSILQREFFSRFLPFVRKNLGPLPIFFLGSGIDTSLAANLFALKVFNGAYSYRHYSVFEDFIEDDVDSSAMVIHLSLTPKVESIVKYLAQCKNKIFVLKQKIDLSEIGVTVIDLDSNKSYSRAYRSCVKKLYELMFDRAVDSTIMVDYLSKEQLQICQEACKIEVPRAIILKCLLSDDFDSLELLIHNENLPDNYIPFCVGLILQNYVLSKVVEDFVNYIVESNFSDIPVFELVMLCRIVGYRHTVVITAEQFKLLQSWITTQTTRYAENSLFKIVSSYISGDESISSIYVRRRSIPSK